MTQTGKAVIELKQRLGITVQELSIRASISAGIISRIQLYDVPAGVRSLTRLSRFARAKGCLDLAEIFEDELRARYGVMPAPTGGDGELLKGRDR